MKNYTLTTLTTELAEKYGVAKRPIRYFDVPKRGYLTDTEVRYVKKRFKELVQREICVKKDPSNPICYQRVKTDVQAPEKQGSSYKKDYEKRYRSGAKYDPKYVEDEAKNLILLLRKHLKIGMPLGLSKICIETKLNPIALKGVYDRAVGAYATSGSRAGMSAEQWGYGRVYAFVMGYFNNKDGRYNSRRFMQNRTDYDLYKICK